MLKGTKKLYISVLNLSIACKCTLVEAKKIKTAEKNQQFHPITFIQYKYTRHI